MEEPARRAFEAGRVTFVRNWPYVFATANRAKATKGKFKVIPFPEWEGGGTAGILGGANLVISTFSKNPGASLKFIDYMTSEQRQSEDVVKFSDASPLTAVYEDSAVQKAQPFADELKTAVENSLSRPVSPVYPQISQAIYKNVNQALSGQMTPEEALKQAQTDVEQALQTF
jgi:multiple sugar transport system substrate-binding protein